VAQEEQTRTAVIRFQDGSVRIMRITERWFAGFVTKCPFTGLLREVRYCFTDPKGRRIYMEWGNKLNDPESPPPKNA